MSAFSKIPSSDQLIEASVSGCSHLEVALDAGNMKLPSIFLENRLTATERAWLKKIFWLSKKLALCAVLRIDEVAGDVLYVVAPIFVVLAKWLRIDASVAFSHSR